ncbi:CPP1-like family protein [Crocosphaera sp. XPORK-15E]|uniref:CPP1-like family protein n=1 Tax=Crocosphaera sp. XPORK-15E TaxID=3110247 RepID=UPI002B203063|nr:CPP1-like family protein [Crocosphaera sp. XPORK-15E]MEA5533464.1 CPP1-like family protein [Crocosphaera sp. XPORK-15E]
MSEQTPYEKLGITETASFEEIQEAKNRLSQEYRDDVKAVESIESAYDSIIMERLKMRQEGRIKVPDRIRFPERKVEVAPSPPSLSLNNSPPWLQRFIDTPSSQELLWPTGIFLVLALLAGFSSDQASLLPLLLAFGVFTNIYFLNRKENKFGRALLITLAGLLLGVGLGLAITQLLQGSNLIGGTHQSLIGIIVFFVFWLSSNFLR